MEATHIGEVIHRLGDTIAAAQSGDRKAAERLAGLMRDGRETVATLSLPISAERLCKIADLLTQEYGEELTMRQEGGAFVFERKRRNERTDGE
jgi:hypothetical protein